MYRKNITSIVSNYKEKNNANHRYASFDYCYNYFKKPISIEENLEKSCLVLGFYLASWGMYRGSSFLLQKSISHYKPLIKYIAKLDRSIWKIDVDKYNKKNINTILKINQKIKELLIPFGKADRTLTTKIMLGVFGIVPAYDKYFCNTFKKITKGKCGFSKINEKSLILINEFYKENKKEIDKISNTTFTINFITGKNTRIKYPKAKIIDMYGFTAK